MIRVLVWICYEQYTLYLRFQSIALQKFKLCHCSELELIDSAR